MSSETQVSPDDIAGRRIFRLALGVTLSLIFSQAINWPLSYIAPVFTLLILGLPVPAPSLKAGIKFVIALLLPVYVGTAVLIPLLEHTRWAGILIVIVALFGSFYFTARGGSMVIGTFMTIGLTLIITVGSVSIDGLLAITNGLALGAISGIIFVWIAHALLPELPFDRVKPSAASKPAPPSLEIARRRSFRSLVVVLPIVIFSLFSSASIAYIAVMIKVAAMGQEANVENSREMGRTQIESTFWGGLAAVVAWQVMSIWPSLLMYSLLIALAGLLFGARIFNGKGMHSTASMWSYAFLTMIIVLAPALLDGQTSDGASSAFYSRLFLFIIIAIYGSLSVIIFDAFWPSKQDS